MNIANRHFMPKPMIEDSQSTAATRKHKTREECIMVAASVPLHCTELQLGRFDAAGRAELSGVVGIRN